MTNEVTFDIFEMLDRIAKRLGHSAFDFCIEQPNRFTPEYSVTIRDYSGDKVKTVQYFITKSEVKLGMLDMVNLRLDFALEDLKRGK